MESLRLPAGAVLLPDWSWPCAQKAWLDAHLPLYDCVGHVQAVTQQGCADAQIPFDRLSRGSGAAAEAEGVIAELQLSMISYCWRHLSQDEWVMVMHRTHENVAAIAVLYEDQVMVVTSQ